VIVERDGKLVPFSVAFREFVAGQRVEGLIQVPSLVLDVEQHLALMHDHMLSLSSGELRLLERLASEPRMVVSHKDLFEHVYPGERWENGFQGNRDRLKATLKGLNDSLDEAEAATAMPRPLIDSIRGEGYRLLPPPS
jgi:DNA-binding response OmpR family regulator